jgi:glutamate-1-semialdehyde 2,1-aminomutase
MDFSEQDYQELQVKLLNATRTMKSDGWWLSEQQLPGRDRIMRTNLIREMAGTLVQAPQPVKAFYSEVMRRKHDDHLASHSNLINQCFHLLSSSVFIYCYFLVFCDLTQAMCLGLSALFVRQFGHAVLEPPCHDKEELLLGFNTRSKTMLVAGYLLIPIIHLLISRSLSLETFRSMLPTIALQWFLLTLAVVLGHVAYLVWKHDLRLSLVWLIKLVTDPITDIMAYYSSVLGNVIPSLARKSPVA